MTRNTFALAAVFVTGGLFGWIVTSDRGASAVARQNPAAPAVPQPLPAKADGAEAGIKAITAEYAKAFNIGDAKAAAALWTADGEYVGADGEPIVGRAEIEKSLAGYFKANPKATIEVRVEAVRAMGRGLAAAEGVVVLSVPGEDAVESRYSALHVLEDGKWHAASVSEWVLDPATDVTPKHLEWLIGEWEAKGDAGELRIIYAWDADKVFLTGAYTLTKDGKAVSKGTQVIGRNPAGGLRSWMFDSSGATSDAVWTRDGKSWVSEGSGVLPDGIEVISTNVVTPIGPDTFTWQTTRREVDGVAADGLPPVKVARVMK